MHQEPGAVSGGEVLDEARAAVHRRAWDVACTKLSAADEQGLLAEPEDLERLAVSARLTGRGELAEAAWVRAYDAFRDSGQVGPAVRCAFWLGIVLVVLSGAEARGGAWIARGRRLLEEQRRQDCPEWGYVVLADALRTLEVDPGAAQVAFGEAAALGQRCGDVDLVALGRLGQGQSLVLMGEARRGTALLDEAMLVVDTGQASPIVAGLVYCAVLVACQQVFDVRRAQEWTETFSRWCEAQGGLVPFRGQCLVHRSQLAQLAGDWAEAVDEADRACRWLSDGPPDGAAGIAWYQRAELHRLRGEHDAAEAAYQDAAAAGHEPHPGLALLWLAQGRTDAAASAIRRVVEQAPQAHPGVVDELRHPRPRAEALAACVEIMVAAEDVEAAGRWCAELAGIADRLDTVFLRAVAERAEGRVLLAQGRPGPALDRLVSARERWTQLHAPYEAARTRVLVGRALQDLGDEGTAAIELAVASRAFAATGPHAGEAVEATSTTAARKARSGGLTAREVDVVRLVAAGSTNRQIAEELVLSEKTVARHLHNILTKLDLPNRSAATAYAYEHRLL